MFGVNYLELMVTVGAIVLMETIHLLQNHYSMYGLITKQPTIMRWSFYLIAILIIINFGVFTDEEFIYFQF
jgi:alginate O-acetyltransferase complex protein AlgI